jgi:hypothetical protein
MARNKSMPAGRHMTLVRPSHDLSSIFVPSGSVLKAAAIFLLSIYMLTFAEFHHILRIPLLVQHFREHRQLDPSISFLSFIQLHYVGLIEVDEDYEQDRQLPFREADCGLSAINISCECPVPSIEIVGQSEEIANHFILYDEDNNSLLSVADIFQPPRLV